MQISTVLGSILVNSSTVKKMQSTRELAEEMANSLLSHAPELDSIFSSRFRHVGKIAVLVGYQVRCECPCLKSHSSVCSPAVATQILLRR